MLFRRNRPNHSLLLIPVRLGNERWPKNKVRILSCDTEGHLFTQLIGKSVYQRIKKETQQMEASKKHYATICWDTGSSRHTPLLVETRSNETWVLERILEHALRSAIIPDVLTRHLKEIIKLGEVKRRRLPIEKTREIHKITPLTSSQLPERSHNYRKHDVEVPIPIYKAEYAFPLIILKRLPLSNSTPPSKLQVLVLDSDGDLVVTTLPSEQINKAERKHSSLQRKGKEGCLIYLRKPRGTSVDVMEISELQRQTLEAITQYFEETGKGRQPLSNAVKNILNKAKGTPLS